MLKPQPMRNCLVMCARCTGWSRVSPPRGGGGGRRGRGGGGHSPLHHATHGPPPPLAGEEPLIHQLAGQVGEFERVAAGALLQVGGGGMAAVDILVIEE